MDTFVDSSWYFYRYLSPHRDDAPFDPAAVRYWFPIDLYVGGIEHAILHLVYSRFWTKVMRDLGLVDFDEPVTRLFPQGMVHKDGEIMSKSKGNTVAPDDVIKEYGADTLRLYILSVGPPGDGAGVEGGRASRARTASSSACGGWWTGIAARRCAGELRAAAGAPSAAAPRRSGARSHQTIQRSPTTWTSGIHLNTAVAAFHELVNEIYRVEDRAPGRGRPGRAARGAGDAGPAHEPVHAARLRGDVAAPRPRERASWTSPGRWPTPPSPARTSWSWRCR